MRKSKAAAYGRAIGLIVVGFGVPWLAVYLYYQNTNLIPPSWTWAWVHAFGWLLDIAVQWLVVVGLLKLLGKKMRTVFVGSGQWLEPAATMKVFVLLVLTGLSLDYLWQLPWFEIFPEKISTLTEPSTQNFADEETIQLGPAILTTMLMLTVGPIIEEIFYRGLMLGALADAMPVGWAIAVSSLLFGLYHPYDPLAAAFFSAILSVIYLHTRSLYTCTALHVAYNVHIALSQLLTVTFPDSWYRSTAMSRPGAWWLHLTILAASAALTFDFARNVRSPRKERAQICTEEIAP